MKMIMAVIQIDKVNKTKRALSNIGMPSYWSTGRVYGRGKGNFEAKVIEGVRNNHPEAISLLGAEPRLRPQRLITLVVKDDKVSESVKAIMAANCTNSPGDGKIFVLPMSDALRVRTGEKGDTVLD